MKLGAIMAALVLLGGCSMSADINAGKAAVDQFHQLYGAGDFAAIDAAAGPEIQAAPGGLTPVLTAVRDKLGNVKSASQTGFNDRVDNGDHRLELSYDTKFDKGSGTEQFVFRMADGKPIPIGYHVNSAALLN